MQRFERILLGLKTEWVHALENSADCLIIPQSADPMDQMRNLSEQELDSRYISQLTARLRSLEDALRAIRDGTFGRCAACDGEIPVKRIEAIPWSPCCVPCQENAEAAGRAVTEEPLEGGYALAR